MTLEEFKEEIIGMSIDDLNELGGEVDVQGPWACRYIFNVKVEGSNGPIGVHGELVLDEEEGEDGFDPSSEIADVELIQAYDISELGEDDDDFENGEEIDEDDPEYEVVYDRLMELIG